MSRAMEKMESSSMQRSQNSEQLSKIDETLRVLITTLTSQSERIKKIEEAQVSLMLVLTSKTSTSEASEADSLTNDINAIKKTLNEQSETLSELGETVSDKRVLKLSDGSEVSASELQAHSMMKQIKEKMTETTTALGELKKTVGNGRTVRVDMSKLSEYAVGVLDERLSVAVEERVQRIESTLDGYEQRVVDIGAQKVAETAQKVAEVSDKANKVFASLERNERRLEDLEGRIPWTTVGKVAIAVLPLFASLLLVGGLVWGVMSMVGIGPLFGWAWASFAAASLWWQKALIAAATLGGAALFIWVVLRVSRWVYEELR
ncbi:hypothetical protein HMPREF2902_06810 [Actinomyces sp. HMSC035G02]|nr:hypothetical protein HMPREF2902_06810 [Actinomyces sp. HMSC035G02]